MGPPTVTVGSGLVCGVDAVPVTVEATARDAGDGTPRILGLVDAGVREAYHRVLQAFHALDVPGPRGVTTVNFAPAELRKAGSGFDLPLAIALAGAGGMFDPARTAGLCAHGEVNLQGRILPARGIVSVALAARAQGCHTVLTGPEDAARCAVIPGIEVLGAPTVADALAWLAQHRPLPPVPPAPPWQPVAAPELADIRGHDTPKRALLVAAAGGHNLLFSGPPGSGKTALLRRLPGLLPAPDPEEALEVLKVHTAAGCPVPAQGRPFRAPHHTSSTASLLGGGTDVRPGEVTLAHRGVLFLDELPEFRRDALEALRQPLESAEVTIGRARQVVRMPADFLLVAAMNPCPCGYLGHPLRACRCPPALVDRYRSRLSGPLLDRIDLQVEVPALDPVCFRTTPAGTETTAGFREQVVSARARQAARQRRGGVTTWNGRLEDAALHAACGAGERVLLLLEDLQRMHRLGTRARIRLLRIARTLADLAERERITEEHVLEAACLRGCGLQPTY